MPTKRSVYFRPMARRAGVLGYMTISEKKDFVKKTSQEIKRAIKREAARERWLKKPTPGFFTGVDVKIDENSVSLTLNGAISYQEEGVEKHQMTYLKGLTIRFRPRGKAPIVRTVSAASLKRGGWIHPGYKGKGFVERAVEKTKDIMADRIAQAVANAMVDSLSD